MNRKSKMRPFSKAVSALGALLVAGSLVAACGSNGPTRGGTSPVASAQTIVIKNFAFSPSNLTVAPGATVTVRNEDSATHTVTAVAPHDRIFDTGDLSDGATTTFTAPSTAGTYSYICQIHQFMHGTLTVK